MLIDTSNYQFWIMGLLWFMVPIMAWFWSLASIRQYRSFNVLMKDAHETFSAITKLNNSTFDNLAQIKRLHDKTCDDALEGKKLKAIAEHELKTASDYYTKIKLLLENSTIKTEE
jgi:hypothetical protein